MPPWRGSANRVQLDIYSMVGISICSRICIHHHCIGTTYAMCIDGVGWYGLYVSSSLKCHAIEIYSGPHHNKHCLMQSYSLVLFYIISVCHIMPILAMCGYTRSICNNPVDIRTDIRHYGCCEPIRSVYTGPTYACILLHLIWWPLLCVIHDCARHGRL